MGMAINPPPANPPGNNTWIWSWTYDVQYAASPGAYGTPPVDAPYSVNIDAPPTTNPSSTTLNATFSKAGYWRITNIKATVSYSGSTASGTATNLDATAVAVTISPDPIYVSTAGTALPAVTVTPAGAASMVTFDTVNATIATATGTSPYITVFGMAAGTTQLRAKSGATVLASVDVKVLNVSYSPQSGPVFTKVVFAMDAGVTYFSSNTTIQLSANGTYFARSD